MEPLTPSHINFKAKALPIKMATCDGEQFSKKGGHPSDRVGNPEKVMAFRTYIYMTTIAAQKCQKRRRVLNLVAKNTNENF